MKTVTKKITQKTKDHQLPSPKNYRRGDPLIFIDRDKILALYNQAISPKTKPKGIGRKVREWFIPKAKEKGWIDCAFLTTSESATKYAGCILFHPDKVKVEHRAIVINLPLSSDS